MTVSSDGIRRMLVTTAHPDDESFGPGGTLAKYAAEGTGVYLACATRGEAGGSDVEDLGACEDLACKREQELRCAAAVLGLADVFMLGYRDSGMAGSPQNDHPNAFVRADTEEVAAKLLELIRRSRPQVILTSDPYGGYGHPDHIAIHRATYRAWELAQDALPAAERPQKMYYSAMPRTLIRWAVRLMPLVGRDPSAMGANGDINLRDVLEHGIAITTRVNVLAYYDTRQRASACHASQLSGPGSISGWMPRWLVRRLGGTDTFHRAFPPFVAGSRLERDLFEGVVS